MNRTTLCLAIFLVAAVAAHAETVSPKILEKVPIELRGLWCLSSRIEPVPNPWTGNPATEYAFKRCVHTPDKTDPNLMHGPLPDLTVSPPSAG